MKESRKRKFDVKIDEGIFLRYSYRSKAYKCLNLSTHKIIKSVHVRIDEFVERSEEESNKEPNDYKRFIYYEPNTLPNLSKEKEASPTTSPEATKLQTMQESHSHSLNNLSYSLKELSQRQLSYF